MVKKKCVKFSRFCIQFYKKRQRDVMFVHMFNMKKMALLTSVFSKKWFLKIFHDTAHHSEKSGVILTFSLRH